MTTLVVTTIARPAVLIPAAVAAAIPARVLTLVTLADPLVTDELHGLAASAVAAAIAAPVLLVRRRH
ncbi:MAG: hypothetical protein ACXWCV_10375, partial [Caldimonas sp.]